MKEAVRNAVAKIIVQSPDGDLRGTGVLVGEGLVLTALHVVADRRSDPPLVYHAPIILEFRNHRTRAYVVDNYWDRLNDWVLIRCEEGPPNTEPLPLARLLTSDVRWETFGFPEANPRDGLTLTGEVDNHKGELEGVETLQLFSKHAAAGSGAPVSGLSGAPVIIQDAVVGVVRFKLGEAKKTVAGTLYACPSETILRRCGPLVVEAPSITAVPRRGDDDPYGSASGATGREPLHLELPRDPLFQGVSWDRQYTPLQVEQLVSTTAADLIRTADTLTSIARGGYAARADEWRKRMWHSGVVVALLTVITLIYYVGTALLDRDFVRPWLAPADTSTYVVLPFGLRAGTSESLQPEQLLHDAFARWDGINVVDQFQVSDALAQQNSPRLNAKAAYRIARDLRAGRYVWGEIYPLGDSIRVHAVLYEAARGGRLLHEQTFAMARGVTPHPSFFIRIADALLFRGGNASGRDEWNSGRHSMFALRAYVKGQSELQRWNLPEADSAFAAAVRIDSSFAAAHLWLAQVRNWVSETPSAWRNNAERAASGAAALPAREQKLAAALLHMAHGDYPAACSEYRDLQSANPQDFAAAYGLGECNRRDDAVIRAQESPSGWRFRTSSQQAIDAYRRAFQLLPSIHKALRPRSYERVRRLLYTSTNYGRSGRALPPDTMRFAATPSWKGDTLLFVPIPLGVWDAQPERTVVSSTVDAVDHQRQIFLDVAAGWRAAFSGTPETAEAIAVGLEMIGDSTALDTLSSARAATRDSAARFNLAAGEVWLGIKFGTPDNLASVNRARALADSLLHDGAGGSILKAEQLASLATITGRADMAVFYASALHIDFNSRVTPRTAASSKRLLARAALCAPSSELPRLEHAIALDIRNTLTTAAQPAALGELMSQSAMLALPVYRFASPIGPNPMVAVYDAVDRGDSLSVRRFFARLKQLRAGIRPADVTIDNVYTEAFLLYKMGDLQGAIAWLDPVLNATQLWPPDYLNNVARAGAFVRAMTLRAQLAARTGDLQTAQRWAQPVVVLWSNADPALQPIVSEMRQLAEGNPATPKK